MGRTLGRASMRSAQLERTRIDVAVGDIGGIDRPDLRSSRRSSSWRAAVPRTSLLQVLRGTGEQYRLAEE